MFYGQVFSLLFDGLKLPLLFVCGTVKGAGALASQPSAKSASSIFADQVSWQFKYYSPGVKHTSPSGYVYVTSSCQMKSVFLKLVYYNCS